VQVLQLVVFLHEAARFIRIVRVFGDQDRCLRLLRILLLGVRLVPKSLSYRSRGGPAI
jgi:hypothetical protein